MQPSTLSDEIRTLMRTHPHSLAAVVAPSDLNDPIVTRPKDRTVPNPNQQSALLVSSLNTVTLHPTPYISFNIKTPGSQTYKNIRKFGKFAVSGLDDPVTAHAFVEKFEDRESNKGRESWRRFLGSGGKVKQGYGGRWWLLCTYEAKLSSRVGDHAIVVGKVLDAGSDRGTQEREQVEETGMVYLDGQYRRIGPIARRESLAANLKKVGVPDLKIKRLLPSEHNQIIRFLPSQ